MGCEHLEVKYEFRGKVRVNGQKTVSLNPFKVYMNDKS